MSGMTSSPIRYRARKALDFAHATYSGVRDSVDPSYADPSKAFAMTNVYPLDPNVGAGIVGRPGFTLADSQLTGAGVVQRTFQFTKLDGTEYTVAVCAGEIYTYNWGTDTWTRVVTTANLTTASAALDSTARVYVTVLADEMIFSDGTNIPFSWDGTSGAGGITDMTNCPVLFGQPVVYYSKLFGIKNAERTTIVWSEENQVNTGYEAGGYNNAWTLGQTEQDQLFVLIPSNVALYYQRARSTGAIWGPVTDAFQSSGTHEAISTAIGSTSPAGWTVHQDKIYFVDADARPQVLEIGGGIREPGIWTWAREMVRSTAKDQLANYEVLWNPDLNLIHFCLSSTGTTVLNCIINYRPDSDEYVGIFSGFNFKSIAVVKDGDSRPVLLHGDDSGYTYYHGTQNGSRWQDADTAGDPVAIDHVLEGATMGYSTKDMKIWDRLDMTLRIDGQLTGVDIWVRTPYGLTATGLTWGGTIAPLWNTAIWNQDAWSDVNAIEARVSVGLDTYARWMRVRLVHSTLNERFGFIALEAEALPESADVEAY